MTDAATILIVEDDIGIQNQLKWSLSDFNIVLADDYNHAIAAVRQYEPPIVLLDLGLPPDPGGATEGIRILTDILSLAPLTKIIVITGNEDRVNAIEAVGLGAYDFYNKPIDADVLAQVVDRAINLQRLERENQQLQISSGRFALDGIIAVSEPMARICREIEKLAPSNIATLLLGESGTGKELLARALHELSPRANKPMVSINCAAIPDNLLESELFGYEKGAFTGAVKQTKGKLEYADGGTLFLDEIGDLPLPLQAKLLRFLQEKVIERVGGRTEIRVDARIVSATHQDLTSLIGQKLFREDLYYRLGEVTVNIPPLRERQSDSLVLARHFLNKFSAEMGKSTKKFTDSALKAISIHGWPGNIRELENKVKRATVMGDGKLISVDDLGLQKEEDAPILFNLKQVREKAERDAIIYALEHSGNNMSKAAKLLGISRPTLYDLIEKLGIEVEKRPKV